MLRVGDDQVSGVLGHRKAASCVSAPLASRGVSPVWKNNPEAKTEANVETAALCNVDVDVFFWTSEFALPTDPVGVQKPFLTLGGLNHVSLFIPILIISSDSLLFTVFQSKSSHT